MRLTEILLQSGFTMYELTEEERRKLKAIFLEILRDIIYVCEKYTLIYFLGGGSCLGAVRHGGFIPWDDDIDIMMPRDSYDKLPSFLQNEFSGKYFFTGPGYSSDGKFLKIHKRGTTFETFFDDPNEKNGIEIDVFPIENVPQNKLIRDLHGFKLNFYSFVASCTKLVQNPCSADIYLLKFKKTRIKMRLRKIIGFLFGWKSYSEWLLKFDKLASKNFKSDFVSIPSGRKHYFGELQQKNIFFPYKYGEFESLKVALPNNYSAYLTALYGDYMQLPPVEKREKHFVMKIDFGEEPNA